MLTNLITGGAAQNASIREADIFKNLCMEMIEEQHLEKERALLCCVG